MDAGTTPSAVRTESAELSFLAGMDVFARTVVIKMVESAPAHRAPFRIVHDRGNPARLITTFGGSLAHSRFSLNAMKDMRWFLLLGMYEKIKAEGLTPLLFGWSEGISVHGLKTKARRL